MFAVDTALTIARNLKRFKIPKYVDSVLGWLAENKPNNEVRKLSNNGLRFWEPGKVESAKKRLERKTFCIYLSVHVNKRFPFKQHIHYVVKKL